MSFGRHPVISVPPNVVRTLDPTVASWTPETLGDAVSARDSLGALAMRLAGTPP
jgi:hypothetical protein